MKVKDIIRETKGKLIIGNIESECDSFCKDTRILKPEDTYIGIKGENFDGSTLWKQAFEKGAKAVIIQNINFSKNDLEKWENKIIIEVEDTIEAIAKIATYKRELQGKDFQVVGVTGSVGKTSTKDIISNVVSQKYKTLKTQGNNNNNIGLPFTIFNLQDQEAAVIEMGMNHFGELSKLTKIAKPTISVITNVGTSHIGNLGSRENILKAKLEILEGMDKKVLVINNDNDLLNEWNKKGHNDIEIHTYGIENASEVMAENIKLNENDSEFICNIKGNKFKVKVPVGGIHFVYNAICSATVGNLLGLSADEIKKGIENFELTKKRMDILELKNGITIINDTYNASFESMKASLEYLKGLNAKRKIAVLGDMFELGEYSKELHEKVGVEVYKNNIDILICNGENAKNIIKSAEKCGMNKENIYYFEDKKQVQEFVESKWEKGDVILFKASNGMKFFDIVSNLEKA